MNNRDIACSLLFTTFTAFPKVPSRFYAEK